MSMNARRIIELVNQNSEKNPFELATIIAAAQREADAQLAEDNNAPDLAAAIRAES